MSDRKTLQAFAITLAATLPLLQGCASKRVMEDYETEIVQLREERTDLKKRNRDLNEQLQTYEVALSTVNSELVEAAALADAFSMAQPDPALEALGITATTRDGMAVFSVDSAVLFPAGSATLSDAGQESLSVLGTTLRSDHGDGFYWIEGHTDGDPIQKSGWDSNRDLSLARAMAVLHHFVEECGVSDDDCVVAGHGQYSPLVANDSAENKARNRRVEIVVKK